ncbi:cathelicidin-2 [Alligator sinensis]|uniref:Cathelicidin-2 n=1 Tax=Alligator sinensis TaxID=38654 RepID=A0A1U7S9K4_ALLSI|nr:cathelicidin-2 [Alligator sinensis]
MQTCWVILLLPLLGAASTELPTPGTDPPQLTPTYAQALATAVDVYNQGPGVDFAFRLLEAESRDDWDASTDPLRQLEFTLKETECPVGEDQPLDQCDFKDGGAVLDCTGTFSCSEASLMVLVTCQPAEPLPDRVRRGLFKKLRRKIKKGFKKIFKRLPPVGVGVSIPLAGRR